MSGNGTRRTARRHDISTVTDYSDDDERSLEQLPSPPLLTSSPIRPSSLIASSSSAFSAPQAGSSRQHQRSTHHYNSHNHHQHHYHHHNNHNHNNHGRRRRNSQTASDSLSLTTTSNTVVAADNNIPQASVANKFALDQNRIGLHENDPRAFISLCLPFKNDGRCEFTREQCSNVHGDVCEMCGHAALHPFNELYKRNHIANCVREHEINMEHSFAIARSRDKTCGICLEVVVEKTHSNLFGILSNCGHCFCVECIRKWRTQRSYNLNTVRSCPLCRQNSDFVCPSRFWVEGDEEKERLIADYKQQCSTKACRYFRSGAGVCPFGNQCFYLHALPNGVVTDVGPPPSSLPQNRRRRRRRNRPNRLDRELGALLLLSATSAFDLSSMSRQESQSTSSQSLTPSASLQALLNIASSVSSITIQNATDEDSSSTPSDRSETANDDDDDDDGNQSENSTNNHRRNRPRHRRHRRRHRRQQRHHRDLILDEDALNDSDEIQFDLDVFRFSLRELVFDVMDDYGILLVDLINFNDP